MDLLTQKNRFDSVEFQEEFHCTLPLGAMRSPEKTLFRLWAPTAERVFLNLYADGTAGDVFEVCRMTAEGRGCWVWETARDLDGTYYDYEVTVEGVTCRTADPWAKACGCNGLRSMVIDLARTDPAGWEQDQAPAKTPENVIWECHVKDFSFDPAGGFDPADRGKYSAFCRTGTTLNGDGVHPTGVDYLKRLGVTHVQLLPVYDYGSVDEAGDDGQFNWGYDPVNYNVPEGSYASDPHRGEVRIRELKQAVQSLHANGFRVIMDVVYNHTYKLDSWLFRIAPWYFYRQKPDGTQSDGSGCGDDIATERSMASRYILESVLYWAEEYHMDGFRFDLMGLMDTELMDSIQKALDEKFGTGEKQIYGEPWVAAETWNRPGSELCHKGNLKAIDGRIGAFCDNTRDAVKGSLGLMDKGFVNGGGLDADKLAQCLGGWTQGEGAVFRTPDQTITYLSCHDDWTLWDKLVYTMDETQDFQTLQPHVLRANRLAAAMNFCCQGHLFFLSGEEFGRTKDGVKNSYKSSPQLNRLDWNRAWQAQELVDWYRGLIALRMQLPGLTDKSETAPRRILSVETAAPDCAAVLLENGGSWQKLYMVFNAAEKAQTVNLPAGSWQVLVDDASSFRWQQTVTVSGEARLPAVSVLILGQ